MCEDRQLNVVAREIVVMDIQLTENMEFIKLCGCWWWRITFFGFTVNHERYMRYPRHMENLELDSILTQKIS